MYETRPITWLGGYLYLSEGKKIEHQLQISAQSKPMCLPFPALGTILVLYVQLIP